MPILGLAPSSNPTYPVHFDIEKVIRPNILSLHPYRCARDDYQEGILLDANENALGHSVKGESEPGESGVLDLDLHRYPDPTQIEIKKRIVEFRRLQGTEQIFLGVGSDEVIDLLMRVCVAPGKEKIMITPPTYGMYAVSAQVNDVGIVKVPLAVEDGSFQLRLPEMKKAIDEDETVKLIFLCSPGNPTGTLIPVKDIVELLEYPTFKGIVVVDEAYIDFAGESSSAVQLVSKYANICVSQTLSKSFGLAAIRLGVAIAQPPLIQVLNNTKAPYNISTPTAYVALSALSPSSLKFMHSNVSELISSRSSLLSALSSLKTLGLGDSIGGNHANFIMIPVLNRSTGKPDNERSEKVYTSLAEHKGVVVRFRGREYGCAGCLRITVGTKEENAALIEKLREALQEI
ncbi:histidinol-phosphate aminotransferase [Schizopora paradoxa]|uniref:histidinol-phosphate transaminase n=1 Tax=Schizopora paradoxa TaxID=27342 RepID=A0A0H2R1R9_9AGAM|nr:histidinol-phosphate aminotransferase [Schizopora paradoxa]